MVNVPELDSARPGQWLSAAADWQHLGTGLGGVAGQVDSGVAGVISHGAWTGAAATAAHARMQAAVNALQAAHGEASAAGDVLEGLGQAMAACQRALDEAQQMAGQHGLTISADGTVSPFSGNAFERAAEEAASWIGGGDSNAQVAQVQELVTEALRRATQADTEAAAELRRIASHAGLTDPAAAYGDNTRPSADGLTASRLELQMIGQSIPAGPPALVSKWWSGLSSGEKKTLMLAAPGTIGTLAGIPAIVQAHLRGTTGINRVALVNYALNNTFSKADDVDVDNCTNFVSDGLLAAGLRQIGHFPGGRSSLNDWYKTDVPFSKLNIPFVGTPGGVTRSYTWADASDLHAFLTRNGSQEVPYWQAAPGDVVFYKNSSEGIYHASIVTAKMNGQIFYSQHTPGEQNASWQSRQSMPDFTNPHNPTSVIIVRPGQDNPPIPHPQAGQSPSPQPNREP